MTTSSTHQADITWSTLDRRTAIGMLWITVRIAELVQEPGS